MIQISDNILKSLLINASRNGTGTHYIARCPFCERDNHLYIQRKTSKVNSRGENVSYMWECKRCGENGRLRKLLIKLGRVDLVDFGGESVDTAKPLEKKIQRFVREEGVQTDLSVPTKNPPLGWRRTYQDEYLNSRGFVREQYDLYQVGRTKLLHKLRDYVVILVMEDGECKGYVARSERDRKWIDDYNQSKKDQGSRERYLRYQNSTNTDFGKLLMGIDEITDQTSTVIVVEGAFDKTNVDKLLKTWEGPEVKCVCSFGKKLSDVQIRKLKNRGVGHIILLYDPDAVNDSKKYSFELTKRFDKVHVGFTSKCDPGDLSLPELSLILESLESPLNFSINKVQKKSL